MEVGDPCRLDSSLDKIKKLSRLADESSLPTHASEQCHSACRYLVTILAALVRGEDRAAVFSPDWKPLKALNEIKPLHPLIQKVAQGSCRDNSAIEGSGWPPFQLGRAEGVIRRGEEGVKRGWLRLSSERRIP